MDKSIIVGCEGGPPKALAEDVGSLFYGPIYTKTHMRNDAKTQLYIFSRITNPVAPERVLRKPSELRRRILGQSESWWFCDEERASTFCQVKSGADEKGKTRTKTIRRRIREAFHRFKFLLVRCPFPARKCMYTKTSRVEQPIARTFYTLFKKVQRLSRSDQRWKPDCCGL